MFARVTTMNIRTDAIDEAIRIYRESVVPAAQSQKGFKRILLFLDRETGEALAVTLWESKEDSLANEKSLYYQEQLTKFLPFFKTPPVKEGFEVVVDA